jgi:hypothetical protein
MGWAEAARHARLALLEQGVDISARPVPKDPPKRRAAPSEKAVPVICNQCGWKGTFGGLLALGSVGRLHCPKCRADYGYRDGVMPVGG